MTRSAILDQGILLSMWSLLFASDCHYAGKRTNTTSIVSDRNEYDGSSEGTVGHNSEGTVGHSSEGTVGHNSEGTVGHSFEGTVGHDHYVQKKNNRYSTMPRAL